METQGDKYPKQKHKRNNINLFSCRANSESRRRVGSSVTKKALKFLNQRVCSSNQNNKSDLRTKSYFNGFNKNQIVLYNQKRNTKLLRKKSKQVNRKKCNKSEILLSPNSSNTKRVVIKFRKI
mmetsp:Transcript_29589/g.26174  ORF Transcript_29589/g.26174 Transcript_29589/m.26174 type:complete len:123 (-) Transcript_29589:14-382(-)